MSKKIHHPELYRQYLGMEPTEEAEMDDPVEFDNCDGEA
jgi:hypothetical protein